MLQFIEKDAPIRLYYSPGRDLAHCGLLYVGVALKELLYQLDNGKSDFLASVMEQLGVTDDQLRDGIDKFVKSIHEEVTSGQEALLPTNSFGPVPDFVKAIIYFYIAPIFIGTSIKGYKDVTTLDSVREYSVEQFAQKALGLVEKYALDKSDNREDNQLA